MSGTTGTPRTQSYLLTTEFQDGQSAGSVTPQRMRDLIVSTVPWDDPSNTSGLGAPAIIRSRVSLKNASGVTPGSGMSTPIRQANAAALQAAINYAIANGYIIDAAGPSISGNQPFEINSASGLILSGTSGFVWDGSRQSTIINQFYNSGSGAPILSIGDSSGSVFSVNARFEGASLNYGVSQAGLTNALGLVLGSMAWSKIGQITVNSTLGSFIPYNAMSIITGGGGTFFSNELDNVLCWGAQNHLWDIQAQNGSTGNSIDNIDIVAGGANTYTAITGNYINFGFSTQDWHFKRVNCEWGQLPSGGALIKGNSQVGQVWDALHVEGVKFIGFFPRVFNADASNILINQLDLINPVMLSGDISGSVILLRENALGNFRVNGFYWQNNVSSQVTAPFQMFNGGDGQDTNSVVVASGRMNDTSNSNAFSTVAFDQHMPTASGFIMPSAWESYSYGSGGSTVQKAVIVVSAACIIYGQCGNATITLAATGTYNVDLALTMGATGTQLPLTGNTVKVFRAAYTSGTVTFRSGVGGSTITTNAATLTGAPLSFIFNGTAWVTFTPVT